MKKREVMSLSYWISSQQTVIKPCKTRQEPSHIIFLLSDSLKRKEKVIVSKSILIIENELIRNTVSFLGSKSVDFGWLQRIDLSSLNKHWTRTHVVQKRTDWVTSCEMGTTWGSMNVIKWNLFSTCSREGLDINRFFAGIGAPMLQLNGELLQVGHPPLIGGNYILKLTGKRGGNVSATSCTQIFFNSSDKNKKIWKLYGSQGNHIWMKTLNIIGEEGEERTPTPVCGRSLLSLLSWPRALTWRCVGGSQYQR